MAPAPNLEISTVVGCRMACQSCPQTIHVRSYAGRGDRVMTLETFLWCLEKVPKEVEIIFAGMAEPWLNPRATEMVVAAHALGHGVSVFTTCAGMTPLDVQAIRNIPFRLFCIHIPDADGLMRLDPTPDYLETVRACIRTFPQHNFSLIGRPHPAIVPLLDMPVSDSSIGLYSRAGNLKVNRISKKSGPLECTACGPRIDHNVLLPDGSVALCCMTYRLDHILGSLVTGTYEELFSGAEYARIRRGLAGDESIDIACRTCELSAPPRR